MMGEICLRLFRKEDASQLAENFAKHEITDWLANVPDNYTLRDALDFITMRLAQSDDMLTFAIVDSQASDSLLGGIGTRPAPEEACKAAHVDGLLTIGYWVASEHWGKGIAGKAVKQIIDRIKHASAPSQIGATVLVGNTASIRVLEKAGFVRAAQAPMPHKGGFADSYVYVLQLS